MKITYWNKGKKPGYTHEMSHRQVQQYGADVKAK